MAAETNKINHINVGYLSSEPNQITITSKQLFMDEKLKSDHMNVMSLSIQDNDIKSRAMFTKLSISLLKD